MEKWFGIVPDLTSSAMDVCCSPVYLAQRTVVKLTLSSYTYHDKSFSLDRQPFTSIKPLIPVGTTWASNAKIRDVGEGSTLLEPNYSAYYLFPIAVWILATMVENKDKGLPKIGIIRHNTRKGTLKKEDEPRRLPLPPMPWGVNHHQFERRNYTEYTAGDNNRHWQTRIMR